MSGNSSRIGAPAAPGECPPTTFTAFPRISLITPNYNGAAHLEQTIQSVISQKYPNLQYIVIDGGSTDGSVDIIKRYETHIDYWISEPDHGPAEAINKGLERADGDWINWLNSDDFLLPRALHALALLLRHFPDAQWIVGNRLEIDEGGTPLDVSLTWVNSVETLVLGGLSFPQDSTFFSRRALQAAGGRLDADSKSVFDMELFSRLMQVDRPLLTNVPFAVFRRHPGQISSDKKLQALDNARVNPYYEGLPLSKRILRRVSHTRFNYWVHLVLAVLVRIGLIRGPHSWPVAVVEGQNASVRAEVAAKYVARFSETL